MGWTFGCCAAIANLAAVCSTTSAAADPFAPPIAAEDIQPACQTDDSGFIIRKGGCARIRGHIAAGDAPGLIGGQQLLIAPVAPWVLRMGAAAPSGDPVPLDMGFMPQPRDALLR